MARRILAGFLLLGVGYFCVAGCDDGQWGYYGNGGGRYHPYTCGQFASCGSCTPVGGCGWCSFEGGGACLSDPDDCGVSAFSWTWEPAGCGTGAGDAGKAAVPNDAAPRSETGSPDASGDARASSSDAATDR